ncbi:MAG: hypothetical protein J6Q53_03035 [Oscillospiraceae bacterium]|nr:hypothetical protein [Oscillospiraceae bacterium]
MKQYMNVLKKYLAENRPNYGDGDVRSLLEFLYGHYSATNPIDNEAIRTQFGKLRAHFSFLKEECFDTVFDVVCDLCLEHERLVFLEGTRVGARLALELQGE